MGREVLPGSVFPMIGVKSHGFSASLRRRLSSSGFIVRT